uniref:KIAA1549 n=1 Tax=Haemonchus placei TaxID=6290 RepID=A0A0N4W002_HAEPC
LNTRSNTSPVGLPPSNEKPFPTLSPYFTDIPSLSSELVEIEEKNHWYTRLSPTIATAFTPYTTDITRTTQAFSGTTADDAQNVKFEGELHQSTTPTVAPIDSSSNSSVLPTETTKINHWYTHLSPTIASALTPYMTDITAMTPESSGITVDDAQSLQFERKLHQPTSPPQTNAPIDSFSDSTDFPTELAKMVSSKVEVMQ